MRAILAAGVRASLLAAEPSWSQSLRALSTASKEIVAKHLKSQEISHLLHEGGIDFRDCFERDQLVDRLVTHQHSLPSRVQQDLASLLALRTGGTAHHAGSSAPKGPASMWDSAGVMTPLAAAEAAAAGRQPPMPEDGLFADEQRSVELYQRCRPSVVHIACGLNRAQPFGGRPTNQPSSFGSGFIWDKEGHIVTNYHVIHNADIVQVTLSNNKKFKAVVKGKEPDKDLAVLHIQAAPEDLVPVSIGISSRLVVGQKVYAIGNPFGLDHTLTGGLVSGLGRQMQSITGHTIRDVVQTDASINPGNSGGPLLDSRGRLIGVNTAATSHPLTTAGFGFAIPADTVRRIVNQIIRYGRVVRPGLGVNCFPDVHSRQLLEGLEGVVVETVVPGTGAAQAGLRGITRDELGNIALGDVIVGVGGQRVTGVEELVSFVEQFALGDQVPITVHRYAGTPLYSGGRTYKEVNLVVPLLFEARSS